MTGNITTLRYLVDEVGVKTLNADCKGYTPLQMAVVWGQLFVCTFAVWWWHDAQVVLTPKHERKMWAPHVGLWIIYSYMNVWRLFKIIYVENVGRYQGRKRVKPRDTYLAISNIDVIYD